MSYGHSLAPETRVRVLLLSGKEEFRINKTFRLSKPLRTLLLATDPCFHLKQRANAGSLFVRSQDFSSFLRSRHATSHALLRQLACPAPRKSRSQILREEIRRKIFLARRNSSCCPRGYDSNDNFTALSIA